ncbi:hypothetical protein [Micromonospora arborensis]
MVRDERTVFVLRVNAVGGLGVIEVDIGLDGVDSGGVYVDLIF